MSGLYSAQCRCLCDLVSAILKYGTSCIRPTSLISILPYPALLAASIIFCRHSGSVPFTCPAHTGGSAPSVTAPCHVLSSSQIYSVKSGIPVIRSPLRGPFSEDLSTVDHGSLCQQVNNMVADFGSTPMLSAESATAPPEAALTARPRIPANQE